MTKFKNVFSALNLFTDSDLEQTAEVHYPTKQNKSLPLIILLLILPFQVILAQNEKSKELAFQVDSLLNNYYRTNQPGMALAIIQKGEIIYNKQIGLAEMEYGNTITDSTAFHIASVSKQFTAFLAVQLEKEGKLSMNDDIRKYLPELSKLPFKITLSQLANHTHGLPNLFELAQLKGISIADRMSHKDVVNMLLNIKQINFKPGDKYEYNNTGFVLLAEIIERVVGRPFQEVLKNKIFMPLRMNNSLAVSNSSIIINNKAHSYKLNGNKYENHLFNIMANGSSGISTTITDLSKWAVNFQKPNTSTRTILEAMQERRFLNSGKMIEYGLGLEFKNYKGLDVVFHGGGDAAYRSYILHVPKSQFSIVILGNNNDFAPLQIVYGVVDLFLKEHQKQPLKPKKTSYNTQELKAFEGTYEMYPGTYYNIIAERDTLFFQSYGTIGKAPLPVLGDGEFLFPYVPTSKFSFYKNGFNFHIADFKYACTKVELTPPIISDITLTEFTGLFRSKEFKTEYELVIEKNKLVAIHSINSPINLNPLSKDSFYANKAFFGKLDFIRDLNGRVIKFKLSGQNLKDIEFEKVK